MSEILHAQTQIARETGRPMAETAQIATPYGLIAGSRNIASVP